ncbi:MAG: hypothetical protein LWY06_09775 [Firmicutes bacterium]|nr:hypothetical protein [Bacillota bacterium]
MSTTIRVNESVKDILKILAVQEGISMQAILEKALDQYRRKIFFDNLKKCYAEMNLDSEFKKELQEIDDYLNDGPVGNYWKNEEVE